MADSNVDIVIVGAGPIGLAHAWSLKKLNPKLKIKILEQYDTYQRNHVLNIKQGPLGHLMQTTGAMSDPILSGLLAQLKTNPHIRTAKLQEAFQAVLKPFIQDKTVEIIRKKVGYEFLLQDTVFNTNNTIDVNKIQSGQIYLSQDGSYITRDSQGNIQTGSLKTSNISFENLKIQLKNSSFKKSVLRELIRKNHIKPEADWVKEQLSQYNPKLIIGADGTHSIISDTLFPKGNQEKREFSYTLQMRYDIQGNIKPERISSTIPFYQEIGRQGLIAAEYIGPLENGKTPVTLSMVISKQAYYELKLATSKNPLMPYGSLSANDSNHSLTLKDVPQRIRAFLLRYWEHRLKAFDKQAGEHQIDPQSIKISVNETPTTHAKQLFQNIDGIPIVLVGDAALGLSYFKGLNGGISASAHLFSLLKPAINPWNQNAIQDALRKHEKWMLTVFGPKKIREVARHDAWKIRFPQKSAQLVRTVKDLSKAEYAVEPPELIADYFKLLAAAPQKKLRLYPHRAYPLVKINQIDEIPVQHSWVKIKKLFRDYIKPYKSKHQIAQDFKQPIFGVSNFFIGLFKIARGIFSYKSNEIKDGFMLFLRGTLEIVTTPFAWGLKPLTRGTFTILHGGFVKVEENEGTQKIIKQGLAKLNELSTASFDTINDPKTQYALSSFSIDLHRKFQKAIKGGQLSEQPPLSEQANFNKMRECIGNPNKQQWMTELRAYFMSLQAKKPPQSSAKNNMKFIHRK